MHFKPPHIITHAALAVAGAALLCGCGGGGGSDASPGFTVGAALVGGYGGTQVPGTSPADLTLTADGGSLALPCGGGGALDAPLIPDASGHASAAGTYLPAVGVPPPGGVKAIAATYTATVNDTRITLVLKTSGFTSTYAFVRGKTVSLGDVACPA